ncbi:MAG: adenylate/guanylate cyclase domain-containing protein [Bacteroidota bacterium]|nr:adenylate/guanylate cyclase domain-containing protein [Bacteroidota bacterium]
MSRDEGKALEHIKFFKAKTQQEASVYAGNIVKDMGDGYLITFNSALQALDFSISIQIACIAFGAPVRIGMHLGDAFIDDNDVYGNAINLASRIETMGIAGCILMSKTFQSQIKNKKSYILKSVGSYKFQGFDEDEEIFALGNKGFRVPKPGEMIGKVERNTGSTRRSSLKNTNSTNLTLKSQKIYKRKVSIWTQVWNYLMIFAIIAGIVIAILLLYDRYGKASKEKYVEEKNPQGTLKSPKLSETIPKNHSSEQYIVLNQKPSLSLPPIDMGFPKVPGIHIDGLSLKSPKDSVLILCGKLPRKIAVEDLYQGIEINFCKNGGSIILVAQNDRLYTSVEFRDIETQLIIGKLSFNHWEIYTGKFSTYKYDDTRFEVFDPEGYIAFSIGYSSNSTLPLVAIAGYLNTYEMLTTFVNSTSIIDRDSTELDYFIPCIDKSSPNWKAEAYSEIKKNQSIFSDGMRVRLYQDPSLKILRKK